MVDDKKSNIEWRFQREQITKDEGIIAENSK